MKSCEHRDNSKWPSCGHFRSELLTSTGSRPFQRHLWRVTAGGHLVPRTVGCGRRRPAVDRSGGGCSPATPRPREHPAGVGSRHPARPHPGPGLRSRSNLAPVRDGWSGGGNRATDGGCTMPRRPTTKVMSAGHSCCWRPAQALSYLAVTYAEQNRVWEAFVANLRALELCEATVNRQLARPRRPRRR